MTNSSDRTSFDARTAQRRSEAMELGSHIRDLLIQAANRMTDAEFTRVKNFAGALEAFLVGITTHSQER